MLKQCHKNNKKIQAGQVTLWTETFGNMDASAVLLIAGAQAPSIFWPDFFCIKLVNAGYFVIRYDHRDIGFSTHFPPIKDMDKPIYNLNDLANDALAILDDYKIDRANIIGHSMGGSIAQYLAAFNHDRILKAISMSVAIESSAHQHPDYDAVMQELLKNKPTGDFAKDWQGWERSLRLLNGPHYKFDEEMAKDYVKTIYERHLGDFNPAWNQIAAQQNKPFLLDKLPKGMLFINGTEDVFSPCEEIKALSGKFKIELIEDAGHMFFNKELWNTIFEIAIKHIKRKNK